MNKVDYSSAVTSPSMTSFDYSERVCRSPHSDQSKCGQHIYPDIKVVRTSPDTNSFSPNCTPLSFRCPSSHLQAENNENEDLANDTEYLDAKEWFTNDKILTPVRDFADSLHAPLLPSEENGSGCTSWSVNKYHRSSTPNIIGFEAPPAHLPGEITDDGLNIIERKSKISLRSFSARQWGALLGVCYVNFASNASMSILTSFFSKEAVYHGANELEIGLIFGCYAIVNSICCPLFGYLIPLCGAKNMLLGGLLISSLCSFLFSQLFRFTSTTLFVAGCFVSRSIQAVGCSAYFIGSAVIIAREWRDNITFAMGLSEVFLGIGMICGPLLGGAIYEKGGFQLPFIGIGFLMLIGLFINAVALPKSTDECPTSNFLALIKIPNVAVTAIFMCVMWAAMDFNMPTLSFHMDALNASPVEVGTMFLIMAAAYTINAPLVGLVAKTKFSERAIMTCGSLMVGTSFLVIGPSPIFAPLGLTAVSYTCVGISMAILGAGLSAALVPTFSDLTHSAVAGGMKDDLATAGLVGGVFNGATFFGEFLGPTVGGALMQKYKDYKIVSSLFAAFVFVLISAIGFFYFVDWRKDVSKRKKIENNNEKKPCLDTVQTLYDTIE
uniref:MFS-type transporter SLC18B1-like isoform X1 n=2 Tax=Ciona intestinalis TaxID=7719 RepID=UPI000180B503|nr:MFS-type transporter SLC18B1-like isoform X1 [Ciona intestinalis]XP_018672789.1 MFS-type transporter SLC18B1-like isoform X1 [Ciona intestinalis]|eukprot:XP_002119244.3 MFS-type transporter SLC18B1-like isoform X1 [Ciona intestinalis]